MLIDVSTILHTGSQNLIVERVATALSMSTRETDICGWYKEGSILGLILTELGSADTHAVRTTMLSKVDSILHTCLNQSQRQNVRISFHLFPEGSDSQNGGTEDTNTLLYPDLNRENKKKTARAIKRAIDCAGSATALLVLSPMFLAIAIAIKLTSRGPILFKQERIGKYGVPFTFLKFRSMYVSNDATVHKDYVKQFIAGNGHRKQSDGSGDVYKLTGDSRITPLGHFLRRTSLDELPQLFNVLRGDMSLVGPRPPIPYEIEAYDIWHRRRFLEAMPGITGLWQVNGRSKCTFDEMVRLDIKYAKDWSLGLDLKILIETPRAVFSGDGAY
jgi:lipopolysaccharide/colanic/teichoic acid biosynthesis glycosyltransferase